MSDTEEKTQSAQRAEADKAMALKAAAPAPHHPTSDPTSDPGMNDLPNATIAPSGALNAEGQRPVLERSRKVR